MEEYACDKGVVRTFDPERDDSEYVWHRDHEDREIEVLSGEGWQFQYDEKLPTKLTPSSKIPILKHEWHRLWKGKGKLRLKIWKK